MSDQDDRRALVLKTVAELRGLGVPEEALAPILAQIEPADVEVAGDARTDVVIYTQGMDFDGYPSEPTPPLVQIKGRLFVNGREVPGFVRARTVISGGDFMEMLVRIMPSTIEIVPCANLRDLSTRLPRPR